MNIQGDILRSFTEQVGDELHPEVMCAAQHYSKVPETALHIYIVLRATGFKKVFKVATGLQNNKIIIKFAE